VTARGEITQDLLANLFKAYKAVTDREFVTYIHKKEDKYEEGVNIDTDTLMLQADNKFKTMFQAWNAPSPEEEKILALETQIQKLQKEKKKPKQQEGGKKGGGKEGSKKRKRKRKAQSG